MLQPALYRFDRIFYIILSVIISTIITILLYYLVFRASVSVAAVSCIFAVMSVLVYLYLTRKSRKRQKILRSPFPGEWEQILLHKVYYYSALGKDEQARFQKCVQLFLGETRITGIKTTIDDECLVLTAASAVIPVFNIPGWTYSKISEILIYPDAFDENFEFSGTQATILGMVQSGSVLILSKPALYEGFERIEDKQHVGIHEFIHKVDGADGVIDGIPALLMDPVTQQEWIRIMKTESEKIRSGQSDINPYALTNPAEFFSVTSEYFFERPGDMKNRHPELFAVLKKVFRQDTEALFTGGLKSLFRSRRRKVGRNDPCPCGSGKKYKKCCLRNARN